jgi:hypothetical protein
MAGSGRKTFAAGSVLSAADVQNYLQDQSVMVFAGTASRGSAIASPSTGMVSFLTDSEQIQVYNGSNWLPLPYAQAVGTASATTGVLAADGAVSVGVTFPTNRFAVAPIVYAWATNNRYMAFANAISAGTANITVRNVSAASGSDETIYYHAIQMSLGTAVG